MFIRLFRRLLPAILGLAVTLCLLAIVRAPVLILRLGPVILAMVGLSVWHVIWGQPRYWRFWRFVVTPAMCALTGLVFLTFIEERWAQYVVVALIGLLEGLFLEIMYVYFYDRPKYQPHALENIVSHANVVTMFFLTSGMLSVMVTLAVSPWPLTAIVAAGTLALTYVLFWASELPWRVTWPVIVGITALVTEVFVAVTFLPSSVYVGGFVCTICYYAVAGLMRNWLLDIRHQSVVRRYLLITSVLLVLVLVTAKWL
jgi:hypothetical protein